MSRVKKCMALLLVAWMVALAGCAARPPPVTVAPSTWRQIDRDILAASQNATEQAEQFARDAMLEWRTLVYQRTEADFIPWFFSYRTHQWLSVKLSWYRLSAGDEKDEVIDRLALYLQQQYRKRVLVPVARETDPVRIRQRTVRFYLWLMGELLAKIPPRYGVPAEQFQRRLAEIPAIDLAPPPNQEASLGQLIGNERLDRLPAYRALTAHIHKAPGEAALWSEDAGISSVATQASRQLTTELTAGGITGAVSALLGPAGALLSFGMMGVTAMMREHARPAQEALLRKSMSAAFDAQWREWLRSRDSGVMAGVHYLDDILERQLTLRLEAPAQPALPTP